MSTPGKILLWGSNLWQFGAGMLGPLFAIFAEDIGGDVLDISWVYAAYLIVTGVGIILVGKLADKIGDEYLMIAGYALSALATFGYLFITTTTELLFVQILQGISLALMQPTCLALYVYFRGAGKDGGHFWGLSAGMGYVR